MSQDLCPSIAGVSQDLVGREDGREAGGAEQASHLSRHGGLEVVALPARLEDGPPEGRGVEHQEEGRDPHERIHLD